MEEDTWRKKKAKTKERWRTRDRNKMEGDETIAYGARQENSPFKLVRS